MTIARKVESIIFRGVEVDKGAVDVNVAGGVLWLRGEVPTAELINKLETRAKEVTEVRRVENLLHVPASPAPTRPEPLAEPAQITRPAVGEDHVATPGETGEKASTPAPPVATTNLGAAGHGPPRAPLGEAGDRQTADPIAEDEEGSEQDDPEVTPSDEHLA